MWLASSVPGGSSFRVSQGFGGFIGFFTLSSHEVSWKRDMGFQVSMFSGFLWFSEVAWVEKPLETEMLNYWCVWLLLWLMEGRKNVTCCDISVMFKLTCEITSIISHDNHIFAVNTPSPGPSLAKVKFSPQSWPQSCWAQPWLPYQFNMAILPLKSTWAQQELQGDNKDLQKKWVMGKILYLISSQWEHFRT